MEWLRMIEKRKRTLYFSLLTPHFLLLVSHYSFLTAKSKKYVIRDDEWGVITEKWNISFLIFTSYFSPLTSYFSLFSVRCDKWAKRSEKWAERIFLPEACLQWGIKKREVRSETFSHLVHSEKSEKFKMRDKKKLSKWFVQINVQNQFETLFYYRSKIS